MQLSEKAGLAAPPSHVFMVLRRTSMEMSCQKIGNAVERSIDSLSPTL